MTQMIFTAKIIVTVLSVLGLSLVAENISPKAAGILSGYPLGTAIALFFIGLENGAEFASRSATYTLAGLSSSLALVYSYYQVSNVFKRGRVVFSPLFSVIIFLCCSYILSRLDPGLIGGLCLSVGMIVFTARQFRAIPNSAIDRKIKITHWVLLFRAVMAASIVLLVTGVARITGPQVAGLLSAFPITLFPFLLIIHLTYGEQQTHTIIKNFPIGMGSLITYVVSVSFTYKFQGLWIGTFLAFLFATIYLIGISWIEGKWTMQKPARHSD